MRTITFASRPANAASRSLALTGTGLAQKELGGQRLRHLLCVSQPGHEDPKSIEHYIAIVRNEDVVIRQFGDSAVAMTAGAGKTA